MWTTFILMMLLIAAPDTRSTTAPASNLKSVASEPFAKGSPERAYIEFYNSVREGRVENALQLSQPIDAKTKPLVAAQFRLLHAMESFKASAAAKLGADAITNIEDSGMIDPATAATAKAVIDGGSAKISMTPPGMHQSETTEISLKQVAGEWRVFAFDAAGTGVPDADALDGYDQNELPAAITAADRAVSALEAAQLQVEHGQVTAEQVTDAYFNAAQLAVPGIEGALMPATHDAK